MKPFSLKNSLSKLGKNFINKVSGCTYCPLKDSCELKKEKEKENIVKNNK